MEHRIGAIVVASLLIAPGLPVAAGTQLDGTHEPDVEPSRDDPAVPLEEGLRAKMDPSQGLIVHFEDRIPAAVGEDRLPGFERLYTFQSQPWVYGVGTASTLEALGTLDGLTFVEDAWKEVDYELETATVASRAREVFNASFEPPDFIDEPSPAQLAEDGSPIDGEGIGIAVVDTGVDATHPDLDGDKTVSNFVATPEGVVEAGDYTELASTHGTHMAGIAASDGDVRHDRRGAAPGASLYTFANRVTGTDVDASAVVAPAMAMDWILSNGGEVQPSIEVVVNAWSCQDTACQQLNPDQAHIQLASQLAEDAGVTVVFPVGNGAGAGFSNQVNPEARIPTQGVIGVANHDDEETGQRSDCIKSSSSRGAAEDPTSWPDVAAPGDVVWSPNPIAPGSSTRAPVGGSILSPTENRTTYTSVTGTSASAAHVAGVVALVLQANPSLSPAEVEFLLEDTAHKLDADDRCVPYVTGDPTNTLTGANQAAGHGLVDAMNAVEAADGFGDIPEMGEASYDPTTLLPIDPSIDPTHTFYLREGGQLSQDRPGYGPPQAQYLGPGDEVTFTSQPLQQGFTVDGTSAEVWMGTTAEAQIAFREAARDIEVERLPANGGEAEIVFEEDFDALHENPAYPVHRMEMDLSSDPITFEEGDQIRVTISVASTGPSGPAVANSILYSDAHPVPSRIQFGERVLMPTRGSDAWCIEKTTCTRLGEDLQFVSVRCADDFTKYHVRFTGPAGSSATVACDKAVATCTVPGTPGSGVGTCEAESEVTHSYTGRGKCFYTTPDGTRAGDGYCSGGQLAEG